MTNILFKTSRVATLRIIVFPGQSLEDSVMIQKKLAKLTGQAWEIPFRCAQDRIGNASGRPLLLLLQELPKYVGSCLYLGDVFSMAFS